MIDLYEKGIAKYDWWQDWRGECVAIIASGPSAKTAGIDQLKDRIHVIVINECHLLAPWADVLYSCDQEWWKYRGNTVKDFAGIKIGFETAIAGIHRINIIKDGRGIYNNELQFHEPGVVGSGGNSGFQCLNLSAQFGATAIALIGFDMRLQNGEVHWHGKHPQPMRNPDESRFMQWIEYIDKAANKLKTIGIDVVNCSQVSKLGSCYPKMSIEQMLTRWGL